MAPASADCVRAPLGTRCCTTHLAETVGGGGALLPRDLRGCTGPSEDLGLARLGFDGDVWGARHCVPPSAPATEGASPQRGTGTATARTFDEPPPRRLARWGAVFRAGPARTSLDARSYRHVSAWVLGVDGLRRRTKAPATLLGWRSRQGPAHRHGGGEGAAQTALDGCGGQRCGSATRGGAAVIRARRHRSLEPRQGGPTNAVWRQPTDSTRRGAKPKPGRRPRSFSAPPTASDSAVSLYVGRR